jgi:arabinofuranosyltransferase
MAKYKLVILAVSVLIYAAMIILFWDYSIDDAFVTYRYAENLANGHGFVFNPGDKPVEAYSNFLWMLILAGVFSIGLPTYTTAKVLGVVTFLLAGLIWFRHAQRERPGYAWLTGPLFLVVPFTAFWADSGLELGLHTLILAVLLIAVLKRSYWSLLLGPLIVLIRPEGFVIGGVIFAAGLLADWKESRDSRKYYVLNIGAVILTLVVLTGFRVVVFGYPMPNTFYAKSTLARHGLFQLLKGLIFLFPLTLLFLWRLLLTARRRLFDRWLVVFSAAFLAQAAVSCLADAIMNFHFRYMIAFLPLFFMVALDGLSDVTHGELRRVVLAAAIISVFIPFYDVYERAELEKEIILTQKDMIEFINRQPEGIRISLIDVGRIPYYTKARYYDIWGLASEEIAHEGFNPLKEYLRFPDYFVFVGYFGGEVPKLRFGRERLIYRNEAFTDVYKIAHVSTAEDADSTDKKYHYIAFKKRPEAIDSLLWDGFNKKLTSP